MMLKTAFIKFQPLIIKHVIKLKIHE